jgi:cell division protein FtsI (penicillin-binding protein 3)
MLLILVAAFGVVGGRLLWFGLIPVKEPTTHLAEQVDGPPRRGNVYDRNGVLMATSVQTYSVFADPKMVMSAQDSAQKLAAVLKQSSDRLEGRLNRNGRFIWLARQITPAQAQAVLALGLPGVGLREEDARLYPQRQLAAHVIGGVNVDGRGIAGIEQAFDAALQRGEDVHLTVDLRLQQQLRQTLAETLLESEAKAAAGVVMNPNTGEVLAMASLPDYDPNKFGDASANARYNRVMQSVFEMGSTFKLFTAAQALEQGITTLDEQYDCRKPLKVAGGYTIHDYYPKARYLSTKEVVQYSSNIGAAQIAEKMGTENLRTILTNLNLTDRLNVNGAVTAKPLTPPRWGPTETMTISYGHGIAVTPIHVATAMSALVSDGIVKEPTLVPVAGPPAPGVQVVSAKTREQVKFLMQTVVEAGSASQAQIAGYTVGGKTGTAQKLVNGAYVQGKNVSSFAGAVPLENPQMVAVVLVDEAKRGYHTGGRVAAPAFGKFAARSLPVLGVAPNHNAPKIKPMPLPVPNVVPSPVPNPIMVNQKMQQIAHADQPVRTALH